MAKRVRGLLPPSDRLAVHEGEAYAGAGQIIAVVPVGLRHRWVFALRDTPRRKGKVAGRWPVSACIRLYARERNGSWWPRPEGIIPLEYVADIELAIAQLRAAADRLLDEAAPSQ